MDQNGAPTDLIERSRWQLLGHLLRVSKEAKPISDSHYLSLMQTVQAQWQDCIKAKPDVAAVQEVLHCLLEHTDASSKTWDNCLSVLLQHRQAHQCFLIAVVDDSPADKETAVPSFSPLRTLNIARSDNTLVTAPSDGMALVQLLSKQ